MNIIEKSFRKLMSLLLSFIIVLTMMPINAYGGNASAETGREFLIKTGEFSITLTDSSGEAVAMQSSIEDEYSVNSIPYQEGTYYYTAYSKDGTNIGSGQFDVGTSTQELVLRQVVFSTNVIQNNDVDYTIEVKDSGESVSYSPGKAGNTFVLPALEGNDYYNYKFIPDGTDKYWGSSGIMYVYASAKADTFQALNLSDEYAFFLVAEKKQIKIQAPEAAELKVYHRVKFYRPLEEIEVGEGTTDNGITTYICEVPDNTKLHYEVRQEGKITKASTFNTKDYNGDDKPLIIGTLKDRTNDEIRDETQEFYEANLYMNLPDSRYLQLEVGENFDITTFRSWQAVETGTGNYYVEPDYHYEVMECDGSSASVTVDSSGRINAVSPGISVVKVTYDPLDYLAANKELVYSGIWEENTGIIVVDVSNGSKDTFETGIGLSEYDTVYYIKSENGTDKDSCAEYTFTPKTDGNVEVRVQKPLTADWGEEWTDGTMNADGTCTVMLQEGPNIVEVKSGDKVQYHVVYAKGLELTITNLTHPDMEIVNGDKVRITFDGLKMPVPKLAAIYNPGYPNETWVEYEFDGSTIKSEGVQYTITEDNAIEFYVDEAGTAVLSNGRIHTTSIGETESAHRKINKAGMNSNYTGGDSAENINGYYSVLPDIEIEVADAEDNEEYEKRNYANLSSLSFGSNLTGTLGRVYTKYEGTVPQALFMVICKTETNYIKMEPAHSDCTITVYADDQKLEYNGDKIAINSTVSNVKIVVRPNYSEKGYPKTYTIACFKSTGINTSAYGHYEVNIEADGEDMTDRIELADSDENEAYGAGFSSCFSSYNVRVPYNTDNIKLSVESSITAGIIKNANQRSGKLTSIIKIGEDEAKLEKAYTGSVNNTQSIALNGQNDTSIDFSIRHESYDKSDAWGGSRSIEYNLNIERESAPVEVKLNNLQSGASVVIKNSKGNTIEPDTNRAYELSDGTYKYYITKVGYKTIVGTHTVTSDADTHQIVLPDMEKIAEQSGEVTVSVTGVDSYIKAATTVTIVEPEDLATLKYVEYNHGGYTALHAIIDAMQSGISKESFSCRKGILTPKNVAEPSDKGENAGWVCEINGTVCNDPANTMVNNGDVIEYYYNADYSGMQHAAFKENIQQTVTQGSNLTLTLISKASGADGEKTACENAEILINGTDAGLKTDKDGKIVIPAEKISEPGQYTISAQKLDESGKNILTYTTCVLTVKKADSAYSSDKTTVSFRLIGDGGHDGISEHEKYVTWIATKSYTFDKKSVSVYEVFMKALKDAGLSQEGADSNYVRSIKAPSAYGGYWLSEFTNGKNSGWMYTVNGEHPEFGLKDFYVTSGDSIVWHYVDDYKLETSFEGSVPTYPNRWLEAEDVNPPTDKVIDMSKKDEVKKVTTDTKTGTVTTPTETKVTEKTNADGTKEKTATVTVSTANQTEIIKQATDKKSTEIVLEVASTATAGAQNVQLQLNVSFVKNVSEKTDAALTVNTENGTVSLDQNTIKTVLDEAKGTTITLDVNKVANPTEVQKKAAGESGQILSFTVKSGDKTISDFKTGKVTVTVAISAALQNKRVAAIHIAEDGKIEQMPGKSRDVNGKKCYEFTTSHFSDFALVDADELGLETEDEIDAAALVAKLTPVARSAKTAKGYIKVQANFDKSDKAIISELQDAGYTVKYRFYRSTKKSASYKSALTKKTASYTNTSGKKGTKYYYKVQMRVYDESGKLVAKTALKQCKYACRKF